MQATPTRLGIGLAFAAVLSGIPGTVMACNGNQSDYLGRVCILAGPPRSVAGLAQANGAALSVRQYTALYSLFGVNYGGDGVNTFNLPNLSGRMILGAGRGPGGTYNVGANGGASSVTLNQAQLPAHAHAYGTQPSTTFSGIVDLSKATASATLATTAFSTPVAGGTLLAASGNGNGPTPAGSTFGVANVPPGKIFTSTAPTVDMAPNMLTGAVAGPLGGAAPVTVGGPSTLTLAASSTTGVAGLGQPLPTLPPYAVLSHYIVILGDFPVFD